MKKSDKHLVLLIEGNPYNTKHDVDRKAIKGALLSVSLCWQIPIIYSADVHDSAQMLIMAANQQLKENYFYFRKFNKSKYLKKKSEYFLLGLPTVGPILAKALLKKFGTIENVILADVEELQEIEGLGNKKVQKIRMFLSNSYNDME